MISSDNASKDMFRAEIRANTIREDYMKDRIEIVEYYQDTYKGDWQNKIINDFIALGDTRKRASIAREFQVDIRVGQERYKSTRINKATRERYEKLGKTLPPKEIPINIVKRATVHFAGTVWFSAKGYYKDFTRTLTLAQTDEMLGRDGNEPSFDPIFEAYGINPDDIEDLDLDQIDITFE